MLQLPPACSSPPSCGGKAGRCRIILLLLLAALLMVAAYFWNFPVDPRSLSQELAASTAEGLALIFVLLLIYSALSYPLPREISRPLLWGLALVMLSWLSDVLDELFLVDPLVLWSEDLLHVLGMGLTLLGMRRLYRGLSEANRQLRLLAFRDELTQLPNRRAFFLRGAELDAAGQAYGLLLADVDYFKQINDRYGHGAGDEALRRVAQCFAVLPTDALAARVGGEEFAVLLPGRSQAQACLLAEQLREHVAQQTEAGGVRATISVGVVSVAAERTLDAALVAADEALYSAKREGRNCVCAEAEATSRPER